MDISIGSYKFRLEILILIVVVFWIMFGHLLCGCSKVGLYEGLEMMTGRSRTKIAFGNMKNGSSSNSNKESFVGANNTASGPEFGDAKTPGYIMEPSKWAMPTLTYSSGATPDAGVKAIWDRPKQPIPLPEGELAMFATTEFKPECCPNTYSTSTGCACMTVGQYDALRSRFGNNVPYSEY
jgi:hypothetical protein